MPISKEKRIENQRARRLAARPCMICGDVGKATETHKAAPAAPEIRCCESCHALVTGIPITVKEESATGILVNILQEISVAFRPIDMADVTEESLSERIDARRHIYFIAMHDCGYSDEDAYAVAKERAATEVMRDWDLAHTPTDPPYAVLAFATPETPENGAAPFQVYPPRPPAG